MESMTSWAESFTQVSKTPSINLGINLGENREEFLDKSLKS